MIFRGNSLIYSTIIISGCGHYNLPRWMNDNQWMKWTYEQTNDGWFVMIRDDDEDDKSWDRTSLNKWKSGFRFPGSCCWRNWSSVLGVLGPTAVWLQRNFPPHFFETSQKHSKTLTVSLHSKPVKTKKAAFLIWSPFLLVNWWKIS